LPEHCSDRCIELGSSLAALDTNNKAELGFRVREPILRSAKRNRMLPETVV
jgi:hypothetical protein